MGNECFSDIISEKQGRFAVVTMLADYLKDLATDRRGGVFASVLKGVLWLLSLLYGAVIVVLSGIRSRNRAVLPVKIISVGNITWGGTGKTPLVRLIARMLKDDGRRTAVLTRGYGRSKRGNNTTSAPDASGMGDEPYMLWRKLQGVPVIVNGNRRAAAVEAQRVYGADTLLLDDGFQQWGLKKDLDIAVVDAACPFGNGCMIPRGILREPLSALRRAGIFVLTNTEAAADLHALKARLASLNPHAHIVAARHVPAGCSFLSDPSKQCTAEYLRARPVALVSAIGNPGSFRRTVDALQARVAAAFVFPDHHRYSPADMDMIRRECREQGIRVLVTTEKDAVKLAALAPWLAEFNCVVLDITLEIFENEEQFCRRLRGVYSA